MVKGVSIEELAERWEELKTKRFKLETELRDLNEELRNIESCLEKDGYFDDAEPVEITL